MIQEGSSYSENGPSEDILVKAETQLWNNIVDLLMSFKDIKFDSVEDAYHTALIAKLLFLCIRGFLIREFFFESNLSRTGTGWVCRIRLKMDALKKISTFHWENKNKPIDTSNDVRAELAKIFLTKLGENMDLIQCNVWVIDPLPRVGSREQMTLIRDPNTCDSAAEFTLADYEKVYKQAVMGIDESSRESLLNEALPRPAEFKSILNTSSISLEYSFDQMGNPEGLVFASEPRDSEF